jgi:hypothetical protein
MHATPSFVHVKTQEPHRSRARAILAAHPEVKQLMGRNPVTAWTRRSRSPTGATTSSTIATRATPSATRTSPPSGRRAGSADPGCTS